MLGTRNSSHGRFEGGQHGGRLGENLFREVLRGLLRLLDVAVLSRSGEDEPVVVAYRRHLPHPELPVSDDEECEGSEDSDQPIFYAIPPVRRSGFHTKIVSLPRGALLRFL